MANLAQGRCMSSGSEVGIKRSSEQLIGWQPCAKNLVSAHINSSPLQPVLSFRHHGNT